MSGNAKKIPISVRLFWILTAVVIVVVSVHVILQYLNFVVYYQQVGQVYELSNRFDLDDESSVPTWLSQLLFLLIGVLAGLAAYLQTNKSTRRLWGVIAILGLVFSLDEISGLHERALQSLHVLFFQNAPPSGFSNAWWLVLPFLLIIGGWLAWRMMRLLPRRTTLLIMAGGITFLAGSLAVDLLTSIGSRETFLNQGILVAAEEGFELLGSVIIVYAIADYLEAHHYTAISKSFKHLRARN
jgi:hypothetical protein